MSDLGGGWEEVEGGSRRLGEGREVRVVSYGQRRGWSINAGRASD